MLTAHNVQVLQNLIGWALDQDHDMPDYPEHLQDLCESDAYELSRIADALAAASQKTPADSADYVRAARALNENLPDSLPRTDDIKTADDADSVLAEFKSHAEALEQAQREQGQPLWIIRAPWDGPALELEPERGTEPNVPAAARALWTIQELAELVETEPRSNDPEPELARVMLAAGALYAAGKGTLSQCMRTAVLWERG